MSTENEAKVINFSRSKTRKPRDRKAYMRDYMKKRRAKKKPVANTRKRKPTRKPMANAVNRKPAAAYVTRDELKDAVLEIVRECFDYVLAEPAAPPPLPTLWDEIRRWFTHR
jgi:hypothetical protein